MARSSGVDQVLANLDGWVKQRTELAVTAMEAVTLALEGWAKTEHSYTNQTGNTSNSIRGFVAEASDKAVTGILSAGMDYDVFLELAREGKWAFLLPTVERHKDDILTIIAQIMGQGSAATGVVTGNAAVGSQFGAIMSATAEERRRDPDAARAKDRAYRDAAKAARIERGRNR